MRYSAKIIKLLGFLVILILPHEKMHPNLSRRAFSRHPDIFRVYMPVALGDSHNRRLIHKMVFIFDCIVDILGLVIINEHRISICAFVVFVSANVKGHLVFVPVKQPEHIFVSIFLPYPENGFTSIHLVVPILGELKNFFHRLAEDIVFQGL